MKPFPSYVLLEEQPETSPIIPNFNELILYDDKEHHNQIKFSDFFCCMQTYDLREALLCASVTFKSIATKNLFESFIKLIHTKAARHLLMLSFEESAGTYRSGITNVGVLPNTIQNQMKEFSEALSDRLKQSNLSKKEIVDIAIFALTEIGRIHPFGNGNGRVARILMNCILMYYGEYKPIVFADKNKYYDDFKKFMNGNKEPLKELITTLVSTYNSSSDEKDPDEKGIITGNEILSFQGLLSLLDVEVRKGGKIVTIKVGSGNNGYEFDQAVFLRFSKSKSLHIGNFFIKFVKYHFETNASASPLVKSMQKNLGSPPQSKADDTSGDDSNNATASESSGHYNPSGPA